VENVVRSLKKMFITKSGVVLSVNSMSMTGYVTADGMRYREEGRK